MKRLRTQVDRIDLKIVRLLQQRTKLSGEIGRAKRRHRAVIYVPERERDLLARVKRLSRGKIPPGGIDAIYREIMSSSRSAQGQPPIGILHSSAPAIHLPGRWRLGACEQFSPKRTWPELARGLDRGTLALALVTGADLARALENPAARRHFRQRLTVACVFAPVPGVKTPLAEQIFTVIPVPKEAVTQANRALILIECKSTVDAVKSLLRFMPDRLTHADHLSLRAQPARRGLAMGIVQLMLAKPMPGARAAKQLHATLQSAGLVSSILGLYFSPEDYGG
jgi:chorismate mutase